MANGTCQKCHAALGEGSKFCPNCSAMVEQQAADDEDKLLGKIVAGRYRIVKMLGEGGMGRVYLAEQQMGATTRKVAIKTLHQELSGDPQLVARFYRECETVIELSHPNTIQFYDFGKLDDGTLYIVMEYIQGAALAQLIEEQQGRGLDVARCDKILIQVCGSLHEAHTHGIVHRDLKPDNVLLTNRGGQTDFVKVLDFGIAKRSDAEDQKKGKLTQQGMVLGTPPYMSPEQFGGQALDARSDIYSLGIMVYEMLTGKLPFDAKTPWEWATKHLTAQPEPLATNPAAAHVPPAKCAAVMKALQKNRDARQSTVLEFLQEFTGYQDAQAAWTMATSAGGAILPKTSETRQPTAATPVQTPTPMPQPGYGTGGMGAVTPTPGYATGSARSYNGGGYGYTTGNQAQRKSGGGAGKFIAIAIVLLFIVGGGAIGGAWWVMSNDDTPALPLALGQAPGTTPSVNVGGTSLVLPGINPSVPGTNPVVVPPQVNGLGTQPSVVVQPSNDVGMRPIEPPVNNVPVNNVPVNDVPVNDAANDHPGSNDHPPTGTADAPDHGPSAADEASARRLLTSGDASLTQNDVAGAVTALSQAQRLVGRRYAGAVALRSGIERKGSNMVGNLLQRGDCPGAQALFRQLRTVGAEGASRQHFSPDWCARP